MRTRTTGRHRRYPHHDIFPSESVVTTRAVAVPTARSGLDGIALGEGSLQAVPD